MALAIVTGSAGLIGSETVRFLADAGFDIIGIDNDLRRQFFGRFGRMNIGCDFAKRPIMDVPRALRWRAHKTVAVLLDLIPWPRRLKLKSWLRPARGQA